MSKTEKKEEEEATSFPRLTSLLNKWKLALQKSPLRSHLQFPFPANSVTSLPSELQIIGSNPHHALTQGNVKEATMGFHFP